MWPPGAPPHHVYAVVAGSAPHRDHVEFRDHLRAHPDVAREYATLKQTLAAQYANDPEGYGGAKTEFVERVLAAARA
jgi:GrpB-like predicted nucleotidyltransferase (UPF0157 family)